MRGDRHLRRTCASEDEVRAIPAKAHEHQPHPWSLPLPCTLPYLLEDPAWVSVPVQVQLLNHIHQHNLPSCLSVPLQCRSCRDGGQVSAPRKEGVVWHQQGSNEIRQAGVGAVTISKHAATALSPPLPRFGSLATKKLGTPGSAVAWLSRGCFWRIMRSTAIVQRTTSRGQQHWARGSKAVADHDRAPCAQDCSCFLHQELVSAFGRVDKLAAGAFSSNSSRHTLCASFGLLPSSHSLECFLSFSSRTNGCSAGRQVLGTAACC